MDISKNFRILLDKSSINKREMEILSDFMIKTGDIVSSIKELLLYSSSLEPSDIISERFSLQEHLTISLQLREKLEQTERERELLWH